MKALKAYLSGIAVVYLVLLVPLFVMFALVEGEVISMPDMDLLLMTDAILTLAITTPALLTLWVQKRKGRA